MGKITLTNIAEELVSKSSLDKDTADNFVRAFIETIEKGLNNDNLVKIKGLGTFKLLEVSDRGSIDVNTGERITIKGHTKVSFTPDSGMKEFVNRPFAHFEPTELNDGYAEEELLDAPSEQMNEENEASEVDIHAVVVGNSEENTVPAVIDGLDEIGSQMDGLQEVDEEVVAGTVVDIPADTSLTEGHEVEERMETSVDTPVSENSDEPAEEPTESMETITTGTISEEQLAELSVQKGRPRWFLIILLIALVGGAYYYLSADKFVTSNDSEAIEEIGKIMVNPNLGEELGAEWGDEYVDQTIESTASVADTIKDEEVQTSIDAVVMESQSLEEQIVKPVSEVKNPVTPSTSEKANSLVITESVATKNIKDITPADTTDYIIVGTLSTHTLQSGETIIQLARKYYGDKRLWPYIVKYNHITDFNKVGVGMAIEIPVLTVK